MDNYQQQGGQYQQPYQQPQAYDQQAYQQQGYQQQYQQQGYQQPYIQEAPAMGFGEAISTCFKKYATFSGRATRAEFWWFTLFSFIVSIVVCWIPILGQLIGLALFIPGLAVAWRRLHDIGKGGGFYFIGWIPLVGWIFMIIWYTTKSEPFDNRFGPYLG